MSVNVGNVFFKNTKNNLTDYLVYILGSLYDKKECNLVLEAYMEARFYNYATGDSMKNMIINYLKEECKEVDNEKLNNYILLFKELFFLDYIGDIDKKVHINNINNIRTNNYKINDKKFVDKFYKMITSDQNKRNKYIDSFVSDDFSLNTICTNIKNVYDTIVNYNIEFNPLYSEYAINNAFNTGIVKEDKMSVEYYLFIPFVLKDIIKGIFYNHYLLDFDVNLFSKPKKITGTMSIIDSDPIKDMTSFKITFKVFNDNKDNIIKLKRDGYNFSLIIDDDFICNDINITKLELFKYVIITKDKYKYDRLMSLKNTIVKEN